MKRTNTFLCSHRDMASTSTSAAVGAGGAGGGAGAGGGEEIAEVEKLHPSMKEMFDKLLFR